MVLINEEILNVVVEKIVFEFVEFIFVFEEKFNVFVVVVVVVVGFVVVVVEE